MKIGVISDTHDHLENLDKAIELLNTEEVELVIHCGDFISPFVIRRLYKLKPKVVGVFGNNDGDRGLLMKIAKDVNVELHNMPYDLELCGKRIHVLHGLGSPEYTRRTVELLAKSGAYDIILYGHTHKIDLRKIGDCLVLNPGEVFGMLTGRSSVAILDIETFKVRIEYLRT